MDSKNPRYNVDKSVAFADVILPKAFLKRKIVTHYYPID